MSTSALQPVPPVGAKITFLARMGMHPVTVEGVVLTEPDANLRGTFYAVRLVGNGWKVTVQHDESVKIVEQEE
jgi:hypothetical protein